MELAHHFCTLFGIEQQHGHDVEVERVAVGSREFDRNRRRASRSVRQRLAFPPTVFASLAVLDNLIEDVSLNVSSFLAQRTSRGERLSEATSGRIQALAKTRPYQTDRELRIRLAFWESLDRAYGSSGDQSSENIASFLDVWQQYIRSSTNLTGSALLDTTQLWLEEFDVSDIGWRPPRAGREPNFFAKERIREAASQFLSIHQGQHPEIKSISDVRTAREPRTEAFTPVKPPRRTTSQPVHHPGLASYSGGNEVRIPGLKGNIEDYWPIPK